MRTGGNIRAGGRKSPSIAGLLTRIVFGALGAACVVGGIIVIQAHVVHELTGERAEATILGRRSACILEYQLSNESDPRRESMACDKAEATAAANPGRHIRVERDEHVRVRFPLSSGRVHETEIRTGLGNKLPANVGIGASIPVLYSARDPSAASFAVSMSSLMDYFFVIGLGIIILLIALFGSTTGRYKPSQSLARAAAMDAPSASLRRN